ncbi:hypothetical protein D3C75_1244390 [compost metagenome]
MHCGHPQQINPELDDQELGQDGNLGHFLRTDEFQHPWLQLRMNHHQHPQREQEHRGEDADKPHPAQVCPHEGCLPVLLGVLAEIEERRRQDNDAW